MIHMGVFKQETLCKTPNIRPIFNEEAMMYIKTLGTHTY